MSYMWLGLAAFAHIQAIFILLLLFPFPTTRQWNWILSTSIVNWCANTFGFDLWMFYLVAIIPCCILYTDSIRDCWKYAPTELDEYMDHNDRKDRRILLLFSQRSYYITGVSFIFCIFAVRILSLRKENGQLCQQIDKLKPVGKGIKQLMRMVNEVQQGRDSDDTDQENVANDNAIPKELLQLLVQELQQNRNRGDQRRGGDRPQRWNNQDMIELIAYYEQIKNQRNQDRANNNAGDYHNQNNPNMRQQPQPQRQARSRLTSPGARHGRIFVQVPQTYGGQFRYVDLN